MIAHHPTLEEVFVCANMGCDACQTFLMEVLPEFGLKSIWGTIAE